MDYVKIEPGATSKPEAKKTKKISTITKVSSSNLPTATNFADSSTNIKKRAVLQSASKGPSNKGPSNKKQKVSMKPEKMPRPSAKTPTSGVSSDRFMRTRCCGCNKLPCTNYVSILRVHDKLKGVYYQAEHYEDVPGNSKRRRHFNDEYKKMVGEEEPDLCAVEFARKWFPREECW
jgi:hypothetical protein